MSEFNNFRELFASFYNSHQVLFKLLIFVYILYYILTGFLCFKLTKLGYVYRNAFLSFVPFGRVYMKVDILQRPLFILFIPFMIIWFTLVLLISPLTPKGFLLLIMTIFLAGCYIGILASMDREILEENRMISPINFLLYIPPVSFLIKPMLYSMAIFSSYEYFGKTL